MTAPTCDVCEIRPSITQLIAVDLNGNVNERVTVCAHCITSEPGYILNLLVSDSFK